MTSIKEDGSRNDYFVGLSRQLSLESRGLSRLVSRGSSTGMSAIGEDEELDPATLATEELRRRRDPLVVLGLERRWVFDRFLFF